MRLRPPASPPAANPQPPEALAHAEGFCRIAGVDEAGRGPWAGPVVAAAVILRRIPLPVRVDDSKRLTALQRQTAFRWILRCADIGVGIVCAQTIDRSNILHATLLAMRQALEDLAVAPDLVLIDGQFAPVCDVPCRPIVHGDQRCYSISCASIVAKVVRDDLMQFYHHLYPAYGFQRHKGYGTPEHAAALAAQGPSFLHRRSFRPVLACHAASK
jgi:ribonuclease HII